MKTIKKIKNSTPRDVDTDYIDEQHGFEREAFEEHLNGLTEYLEDTTDREWNVKIGMAEQGQEVWPLVIMLSPSDLSTPEAACAYAHVNNFLNKIGDQC